jgi:hypothetical protein
LEPKPINNLDNVIKIYAATDYAAAITGKTFCPQLDYNVYIHVPIIDSGKLYTWGLNGPSGRLGLGHLEHAYEPRLVELDRKVHHVSLGTNHAIALCDD